MFIILKANNSNISKVYLDQKKDEVIGKFGFSINGLVRYKLNQKVNFQTGIGYVKNGINEKTVKLTPAVPDSTLPTYGRYSFVQHSITVPLLLQYYFSTTKNKFYLIGGVTPTFSFKSYDNYTLTYLNGNETTSKTDVSSKVRNLNLGAALGFGYQYKLNNKIDMFVQPNFNINLLGIYKNTDLSRYIYSYGLTIGCII